MTILLTVIVLGVLIFVHELGHFLTARAIGIPVYEFALGFGPKLISRQRNGVDYSLRLIPLGGFVRMAGEEPGDNQDPNGYSHRTPLEKIAVSVAGPIMNLFLGLLIFVYSYAFIGLPTATNEPVIGRVMESEPAAVAGVLPGDRVLAIDGEPIATWEQITAQMSTKEPSKPIVLTLQRQSETINLEMVPKPNASTGNPAIGVMGQVVYEKQGIIKSISFGFQQTFFLTGAMLSGLWTVISGGASAGDLAGPVGITMMVGEASQYGAIFLMSFIAFLSINLGILNLLPIPALDGARVVFALAELLRRKPIDPEKEGFIHWLGFMFLMLIIVFVTYNDILRIIKG